MRFCILGPLCVLDDTGREVTIARRQQRALLARLLTEPGLPISTDRLILDLWGDDAPDSARGSLQALVSRLRALLEREQADSDRAAVLVTRPPGYALELGPGTLDADLFVRGAEEGRRLLAAGDPLGALERFDGASRLWRGAVLADLAGEPFVLPTAARLEELRTSLLEHRAAALLTTGDVDAAIADLDALTLREPLRERPWELLLTALGGAGRTAEALDRLRGLRERFRDELGLDVGPSLQAVELALLRGDLAPPAPLALTTHSAGTAATAPTDPPGLRPDLTEVHDPRVTPPIGRDAEWETLTEVLARTLRGSATWTTVVGDAGMGKTTLIERAAEHAEQVGARAVLGRCHEADLAPAFWPWIQILRSLEDLAPGAADLLVSSGGYEETTISSTSRHLFGLFDATAAAIRRAASQRPLVLLLEDVHWADIESLHLADFLAVQLRQVPVAVLVTRRRGEGPPQLDRTLADLARQTAHTRLDLRGLDTPSTRRLVVELTGQELDPGSAARLRDRTGGNPFFTVELARLGDSALHGEAVPDTVLEALSRRIERLPVTTIDALTLAAIHGVTFGLDALVTSSDLDAATLLDHLDPALQARLVTTTDDASQLRFTHALIQEVVLQRLTDLQRRRLHLQVAEALHVAAGDVATTFGSEVAHHLLAAAPLGDPVETLGAARAAAESAEARFAYHEAARWWEGALRVLEWGRELRGDTHVRVTTLLALGRALSHAGEQAAAIRHLAAAIDAAEMVGDVKAMAAAAIAFDDASGFWNWVDYGQRPVELLDRLDRVLERIGDSDPALRVRVLGVRGIGDYYGDQQAGRRYVDEAVTLARSLGDRHLLVAALRADLRFLSHHRLEHQLAVSGETLELARQLGSEEDELVAWTYRITHLLMAGDLDGSEVAYERAAQLSRRPELAVFRAQLGWTPAVYAVARGEHDRAERLLEEARELQAGTGLYLLDPVAAWSRTVLLWEQHRLHELDAGQAAFVPEAQVALRWSAGDRDAAVDQLRELCARPHPVVFHALGTLTLRARLVADLGVSDLAGPLIDQLAAHADLLAVFGSIGCAGPVAIDLARLHALRGEDELATTMLVRCLERCETAGWDTWADRARRATAEVARRSRPTTESFAETGRR